MEYNKYYRVSQGDDIFDDFDDFFIDTISEPFTKTKEAELSKIHQPSSIQENNIYSAINEKEKARTELYMLNSMLDEFQTAFNTGRSRQFLETLLPHQLGKEGQRSADLWVLDGYFQEAIADRTVRGSFENPFIRLRKYMDEGDKLMSIKKIA